MLANLQKFVRHKPPVYAEVYWMVLLGLEPDTIDVPSLALMDSGNLLELPVISERFHKTLKAELLPTKAKARMANKESLKIMGLFSLIYLRFRGARKIYNIQPLVIKDLASAVDLGAQFNYCHQIPPQVVRKYG